MDQVDLMDKTECSAFVSPCGPTGPLKTLFTHLTTEKIPVFFFIFFCAILSQTVDGPEKKFFSSPRLPAPLIRDSAVTAFAPDLKRGCLCFEELFQ